MYLSAFKTVLVVVPEVCYRVLVLVKARKTTMYAGDRPTFHLTDRTDQRYSSKHWPICFLKSEFNRLDQILIEERLATGCRCPIQ